MGPAADFIGAAGPRPASPKADPTPSWKPRKRSILSLCALSLIIHCLLIFQVTVMSFFSIVSTCAIWISARSSPANAAGPISSFSGSIAGLTEPRGTPPSESSIYSRAAVA